MSPPPHLVLGSFLQWLLVSISARLGASTPSPPWIWVGGEECPDTPQCPPPICLCPPPPGVLHPQREDHRQEGGGGAAGGVLPHRRDAQQRREGQGRPAPPQWLGGGHGGAPTRPGTAPPNTPVHFKAFCLAAGSPPLCYWGAKTCPHHLWVPLCVAAGPPPVIPLPPPCAWGGVPGRGWGAELRVHSVFFLPPSPNPWCCCPPCECKPPLGPPPTPGGLCPHPRTPPYVGGWGAGAGLGPPPPQAKPAQKKGACETVLVSLLAFAHGRTRRGGSAPPPVQLRAPPI